MFKVAVVTGTRAEYGLLRPVLHRLNKAGDIALQLVATGAHLAKAYGNTVEEIESDGFETAARLDILGPPAPQGKAGTAHRTALALQLFAEYFEAARPDAVLLLGDRYEILAAGQAAALLDIPLAHISGGDVTAGANDDWFRHCLTKMAKLHFPSCEVYRQRIIRMGEEPWRVFNVGGLGDENIRKTKLLSQKTLAGSLGIKIEQPFVLVTLHPETLSRVPPAQQAETLLAALEKQPQLYCLFTAANADAGGDEMNRVFEAFCAQRDNAWFIPSLGVLRYLSAMKHAAVVLGNSSSGVVETPSMGVPAVDIGMRQQGRETGPNVLHCGMETAAIEAALEKALQPAFRAAARTAKSPYNGGETSARIVETLQEFLQKDLFARPKLFYDGEAQP